jgi:4a-hydroxytetrahydrobiopterin dehydratase
MKAVLTAEQLCSAKCLALDNTKGNDYTVDEIAAQLPTIPQWHFIDGFIERQYNFENYYETIAFVNALAWELHTQDHHPEMLVSYSHCLVKFKTHSVNGISINDFICAAKADKIAKQ